MNFECTGHERVLRQLGALGKVRSKRSYVMTGIYNDDPKVRENKYHGVNLSLKRPLFAITSAITTSLLDSKWDAPGDLYRANIHSSPFFALLNSTRGYAVAIRIGINEFGRVSRRASIGAFLGKARGTR